MRQATNARSPRPSPKLRTITAQDHNRYQLLLLERDDASANTQPDNYRGGNRGVVAVTAYETLSAATTLR